MITIRLHSAANFAGESALQPADRAVIFIVDGLSPDDVRPGLMPVLSSLSSQGTTYRNGWIGQMETVEPTSAASIATGALPRVHSIVAREWRDPKTAALEIPTEQQQVHNGVFDLLLESRPVIPLARFIKDRFPTGKILSVGGSDCSTASAAGTWLADYVLCPVRKGMQWVPGVVSGHSLPAPMLARMGLTVPVTLGQDVAAMSEQWSAGQQDNWIARGAVSAIAQTHPRLTIVNFPEVALLRHWVNGRALRSVLRGVDHGIGSVLSELRRENVYAQSVFVVTSGTEIAPLQQVIPVSFIEKAVFIAGGEQVYIDADGAAMIGLKDRLEIEPVVQELRAGRLPYLESIYTKRFDGSSWSYQDRFSAHQDSALFRRVRRYLWATMASSTSPDIIVTFRRSTGSGTPTMGYYRRIGAARGVDWVTQHIPIIISGHGVLPSVSSSYPARLVDVAPTVAADMNLPLVQGNGNVLADALITTTASERHMQNAARRQFAPLVSALQHQTP